MKIGARGIGLVLGLAAQLLSAQSPTWRGTWTATGLGRTLTGTWSASRGEQVSDILGFWTLLGPDSKPVASGSWSARKADRQWEGAWQSRLASGQTLSGSWTAQSALPASSAMSDLLEAALSQAAQGTWQRGARKGAWAIRAYPPDRAR